MRAAEDYEADRQKWEQYVVALLQSVRDGTVSQRDACRDLDGVNRELRALRSGLITDMKELQEHYRNARGEVDGESLPFLTAFFGSRAAGRARQGARLQIAQEKSELMGPYERIKHNVNVLMGWVRSHREYIAAGHLPPAP